LEWKTAVEIRKAKSSRRNHESGNELQVRKMNKDSENKHGKKHGFEGVRVGKSEFLSKIKISKKRVATKKKIN
jgi:hypothetical protein